MSDATGRHAMAIAQLAEGNQSNVVQLALQLAADHRPVHPSSNPDHWYCNEIKCAATPWPCTAFRLAEEVAK